MSESSSTPSQTSGSRLHDSKGETDHALTEGLDLGFDGAEDILRAWRRGTRPDADLTVSEWADAHRWLSSRASAEPGRYRTARTPYLRGIMDALSPSHPAQRISFMKAAQVGATEAGNNWIGFVIHHAPGRFEDCLARADHQCGPRSAACASHPLGAVSKGPRQHERRGTGLVESAGDHRCA